MIATWQYVLLGGLVALALGVQLYRGRRTTRDDAAFLRTLEPAVVSALAERHFVPSSARHSPKSLRIRSWEFEGPAATIELVWDGRERELTVTRRVGAPPASGRQPLASFGIAQGSSAERYRRVLDGVLDAIDAATRSMD